MAHKTTQKERVEHLLRVRGSQGVHTHELRAGFIANPSQRIAELEGKGWQIKHVDEKLNGPSMGTRYVLLSEPDESCRGGIKQPLPAPSPSPAGSLFDIPVGKAERPHWQDAA